MRHLIIGMGNIGKRHYRLLKEAGEKISYYDTDSNTIPEDESIYEFGHIYGGKIISNIDMVWICTPIKFHYQYAMEALKTGKRLFIEKPITSTIDEALDIQKAGNNIWVACNMRFHPAVGVLRENLGLVGKILYSYMHFSHYLPYQRDNWREYIKDTNILLDAGIHYVDLAQWLFGDILIYNHHFLSMDKNITQSRLHHKSNDIYSFIHLDYLRRDKSCGIEIIGTKGSLVWRSMGKNPETASVIFRDRDENEILFCKEIDSDEMYRNQIKYLLNNPNVSNVDEAIEVMRICA